MNELCVKVFDKTKLRKTNWIVNITISDVSNVLWTFLKYTIGLSGVVRLTRMIYPTQQQTLFQRFHLPGKQSLPITARHIDDHTYNFMFIHQSRTKDLI